MKDQNTRLYRRISFLVEIVFGLLLLLNGVLLTTNYFGLTSFEKRLSKVFSLESLLSKSVYEWRSLVEFIHAMVATHLSAFVMILMGAVILVARLHARKSH